MTEDPAALARRLVSEGLVPLCSGLSNYPVFKRYEQRHVTDARGGVAADLILGEGPHEQVWVPRWVAAVLLVSPSLLCDGNRPNRAGARVVRILRRLQHEPGLRDALLSALALGGTDGAETLLRGLR